jgi:hypothetical protein
MLNFQPMIEYPGWLLDGPGLCIPGFAAGGKM